MDLALIVVGGIIALVGYVWLLILAFSESILWGVGSLLCGIVALVFGVTRWPETKVPVLIYIAGLAVHTIGQAIAER
jgi:hypothetical protein